MGGKTAQSSSCAVLKGHKSWIAALAWASKPSGVLSIMVLICRMIAREQGEGMLSHPSV
jgi:hypothetical protein